MYSGTMDSIAAGAPGEAPPLVAEQLWQTGTCGAGNGQSRGD